MSHPLNQAPNLSVSALVQKLQGSICIFSNYKGEKPEDGESLSYGDLHPVKDRDLDQYKDSELFFLPDLLSGSDYSGDSVTLTNFEAIQELARAEKIAGVFDVYGGHGTYAIAIRFDVQNENLLETLEGLADYPLIDEDALSWKELELQDEAWESWARQEYIRALEKILEVEFVHVDEQELRKVFEETASRINEYWIIETGANAWIKVDRIAEETDIFDFEKCQLAEEGGARE